MIAEGALNGYSWDPRYVVISDNCNSCYDWVFWESRLMILSYVMFGVMG